MDNKIENKGNSIWESITAISFAVILITSIVAVLTPVSANPNQIFAADGAFGFKDLFGEDEIVYATGDIDPTPDDWMGIPVADLYVVADEPGWGASLVDVSGAPNTITSWMIGGQFFDEIVWLPPLQRGIFYLVIDENQNGEFDSVSGVSDAVSAPFQVGEPVGANIDVTAIKAKAGIQHEQWNSTANHWDWVSDASSAISIGWSIISGDWISTAVGIFGVVTGLPTDYNSAVMNIGGKVIGRIASVQAAHFKSLQADPPDPVFTEFATIDMDTINSEIAAELATLGISATYPFAPLGSTSYEASQMDLANKMVMQSALVSALQSSIEKYQGADNAGDDYYTYLQAQAVKKFSDMLVINLNDTKQALENYKAEQINYGLGNQIYSVAEITSLRDRLATTGLTPDEIEDLKNSGFCDADITAMMDRVKNQEVPADDFTRAGIINNITVAINNSIPAFQNLSAQAQAVMDDVGPYIEKHHPVAVPGGPYTGDEGTPITFDGSGSYDPDGDTLTYEWDFGLDGDFDDAFGATVTWTWNSDFAGIIGLKVNDTTGLSDIAYTSVTVSSINEPPIIDSFSPAELRPTASHLNPLTFSVTAHDPDGDILSYNWTLDGVEVSTNNSWIYTPDATESGLKVVRVTISDGSPLSRDTIETRIVSVSSVNKSLSLTTGWNLISAPLNLTTWELGQESVVGDPLNVTPKNSLTSIYRYNCSTGLFEKCSHYDDWGWWPATGSESFTKLEPGKGYWVMAKNNCNLTFTGTEPSDLNITLNTSWNLIGWYSMQEALLGQESLVGDPLHVTPKNSSTSIYRYNSSTGLFEKCSHYDGWGWWSATGSESFRKLEPGKGYWVMAKNDCVWRHET